MSTISDIEDKQIQAIQGLGLFRVVNSLGRKAKPPSINYPSAFIFFFGEKDAGSQPRPVKWVTYEVLVVTKNVASEAKAGKDAYVLIEAARGAIEGKQLGLTDIERFVCVSRDLVDYDAGEITYSLKFRTRHYLPVPAP